MRYFLFISSLFLVSCLNLDSQLFNSSKIDSYLLDDYKGEVDFILDESFDIPDTLVTVFKIDPLAGSEDPPVSAIYIGNIDSIITDTVIMYCHGNRDHMDFYWQRAKLLSHVNGKNHYGVLMIDYNGYGLSEGNSSEKALVDNVNSALFWLKANGLSSSRLIIYGFSLGSYPATFISAKSTVLTPSKLILEAPFASTEVMVQDASKLTLSSGFFTTAKFNNVDLIKDVKQPLLWIHGVDDAFLSIKTHGEPVFENHKGQKTAVRVPNADHGDVPILLGFEEYLKAVGTFVIE